MLDVIDLHTKAKLETDGKGNLEATVDRSSEIESVVDFINSREAPRIVSLIGPGHQLFSYLVSHVADRTGLSAFLFFIGQDALTAPVSVLESFISYSRKCPVLPMYELLKRTTGAWILRASNGDRLRRIANFVHAQRRAKAPVTLRRALQQFGLSPLYEHDYLDEVLDEKWHNAKLPDSYIIQLISNDGSNRSEFKDFLQRSIFGFHASNSLTLDRFSFRVDGLKTTWIINYTDKKAERVPSARAIGNRTFELSPLVFTADAAREFLRSVPNGLAALNDESIDVILSRAFSRYYRVPAKARTYDEFSINGVLASLSDDDLKKFRAANIDPVASPIDAIVEGRTLRLAGEEIFGGVTGWEDIEAVREEHLNDVRRLRKAFQGSNLGSGFVSRLESVERSLSQPMTTASALRMATQVHALEVMLPSVTEAYTEISASDVAATLLGLSLLARQVPNWRKFIAEAQSGNEVDSSVMSAVTAIASSLDEQSDSVVDKELKASLNELDEARMISNSSTLDQGYLNALNNVYRAAGRYLRERLTGVSGELNKKIDKAVAEFAFEGLIVASMAPLAFLAAKSPNEFGWLAPLIVLIAARKSGK